MPEMRRLPSTVLFALFLFSCRPAPPPPSSPSPTPAPSPSATRAPSATPAPSPTPTPVPVLPRKPVEMGRLFNGVTFQTKFVTPESGQLASVERRADKSYEVQITFTATLPRPSSTLEDLASNDPKLPGALNQMPQLIETAKVSPFFGKLYQNKIATLRSQLFALDEVVSRHNFYDCETILELQDANTGRKALLIIGDMDVNVDGSDGDRNVTVDDSGRFFQPQTSYKWRKLTGRVNPLLTKAENKAAELKSELPNASASRAGEIRQAIAQQTRIAGDLRYFSFLVSAADPTIVVPGFMTKDSSPYAPGIGDYAAVIYDGVIYPALVGDAGPSYKVGEASLRLCRQINPKSSPISRSVSNIRVAYLIFPGTAEKPAPPDLARWREKCRQYLNEIGGASVDLFTWENIVPPWPTPTPTPTPAPSPEILPSPSPEPSATPAGTEMPSPTPEPSPAPETLPSATPDPSPSASPSPATEL